MANGTLRVTPETMLSVSGQFGDSNNTVKNLTQQMMNIASELSNTWAGEAAQVYYGKLKALEPDMQKLYNMIKEHTDDLQQIAKVYQNTEKLVQQTGNSLSGSGIA